MKELVKEKIINVLYIPEEWKEELKGFYEG